MAVPPRTVPTRGGTGPGRALGSRRGRILVGAVLLVLAFNALAAGGILWLRSSVPTLDGRVAGLAGLRAPASVTRDSRGVLYIRAGSPADAAFALGFAHAQDRLWQMELTRRIGMGRLAEIVGKAALPVDRMIRTLGLPALADATLARLSPPARAQVESYAAGVNAYLDTRSGALPPEFVLLGHAPEPWRPADSVVWGRLMALQLGGDWFAEILRARLFKAGLTRADLDTLWADTAGRPSVAGPSSRAGTAALRPTDAVGALDETRLAALAGALPDDLAPRLASNVWVLDGTRTPTGKPVLAGDPHLPLTDPNTWTLARLEAPGYLRVGAFVPGVPFLVVGHNGRVAWSMTTTHSDAADLFVEKLDPADPGRYLTPDGSAAFTARTETIGTTEGPVTMTVRTTRHGPVVSDAVGGAGEAAAAGTVLALASPILQTDDDTAEALFRMAGAADADGFVQALRGFQAPQQNIAFADVDGRTGMVSAGRVPIRRAGDGFLPAEGWSGAQDWLGWAPFDALPADRDPPKGVLVNANDRVVGADPGLYLGHDFDAPYRAGRIRTALAGSDGSLAAMAALQLDTVSLFARELVPALLQTVGNLAPGGEAATALGLLRAWDGDMARSRPEPVIFAAWIAALHERLFADDLGPLLNRYGRIRAATLLRILRDEPGWCDDRRTAAVETCRDTAAGALSEALAATTRTFGPAVEHWRWGDAHRAVFEHRIWDKVPVLGGLLQPRASTGGGDYTVSRGTWSRDQDPLFRHRHGASLRVVYDLADLDRSRFVAALGPSGNPLSPFRATWQDDWSNGRTFTIPYSPDTERAKLELAP